MVLVAIVIIKQRQSLRRKIYILSFQAQLIRMHLTAQSSKSPAPHRQSGRCIALSVSISNSLANYLSRRNIFLSSQRKRNKKLTNCCNKQKETITIHLLFGWNFLPNGSSQKSKLFPLDTVVRSHNFFNKFLEHCMKFLINCNFTRYIGMFLVWGTNLNKSNAFLVKFLVTFYRVPQTL